MPMIGHWLGPKRSLRRPFYERPVICLIGNEHFNIDACAHLNGDFKVSCHSRNGRLFFDALVLWGPF